MKHLLHNFTKKTWLHQPACIKHTAFLFVRCKSHIIKQRHGSLRPRNKNLIHFPTFFPSSQSTSSFWSTLHRPRSRSFAGKEKKKPSAETTQPHRGKNKSRYHLSHLPNNPCLSSRTILETFPTPWLQGIRHPGHEEDDATSGPDYFLRDLTPK